MNTLTNTLFTAIDRFTMRSQPLNALIDSIVARIVPQTTASPVSVVAADAVVMPVMSVVIIIATAHASTHSVFPKKACTTRVTSPSVKRILSIASQRTDAVARTAEPGPLSFSDQQST